MEKINITTEDICFLKNNYPELKYIPEENIIKGIVTFNLFKENKAKDTIKDSYCIEINLNKLINNRIPTVKETENRIFKIALSKGVNLADFHINNESEICLAIPPKIDEYFPIQFNLEFFFKKVVEFFYWVSYKEKFNKEPWPAYKHGDNGYLQLFFEDKIKYEKVVKDHFDVSGKGRAAFRKIIREYKK